MFNTLVASQPVSWTARYFSAGSVSTVVHAAIVAGLAVATVQARSPAVLFADTTLVFIAPGNRPEPPKEEERPVDPRVLVAGTAFRGFQTIAALAEIPTTIPPVDLAQRFDPRDYSGVGVEGGLADGIPIDPSQMPASYVFAENLTEEPPEMLRTPELAYPSVLLAAGVEGAVRLQFIVDTLGLVEAGSIRVLSSTHLGFQQAALDLARRAVFRPARVGGRAVRVLVQMPVNFSLTRPGVE